MTDDQPTQPLNDERLAQIRDAVDRRADHYSDRLLLLAEVDRLRAEIAAARKALFEDAHSSHDHRYRAIARALGDLDTVTITEQSCGDASIWSCALGDHCVCKKNPHGGRHECACGSWWFRDR